MSDLAPSDRADMCRKTLSQPRREQVCFRISDDSARRVNSRVNRRSIRQMILISDKKPYASIDFECADPRRSGKRIL